MLMWSFRPLYVLGDDKTTSTGTLIRSCENRPGLPAAWHDQGSLFQNPQSQYTNCFYTIKQYLN